MADEDQVDVEPTPGLTPPPDPDPVDEFAELANRLANSLYHLGGLVSTLSRKYGNDMEQTPGVASIDRSDLDADWLLANGYTIEAVHQPKPGLEFRVYVSPIYPLALRSRLGVPNPDVLGAYSAAYVVAFDMNADGYPAITRPEELSMWRTQDEIEGANAGEPIDWLKRLQRWCRT